MSSMADFTPEEERLLLLIRGYAALWGTAAKTLNVRPPTDKWRVMDSDSAIFCYTLLWRPMSLDETIKLIEERPPEDADRENENRSRPDPDEDETDAAPDGGKDDAEKRKRKRKGDDRDRAKKKTVRLLHSLNGCGLVEQDSDEFLADTSDETQLIYAGERLREVFRTVIGPAARELLDDLGGK